MIGRSCCILVMLRSHKLAIGPYEALHFEKPFERMRTKRIAHRKVKSSENDGNGRNYNQAYLRKGHLLVWPKWNKNWTIKKIYIHILKSESFRTVIKGKCLLTTLIDPYQYGEHRWRTGLYTLSEYHERDGLTANNKAADIPAQSVFTHNYFKTVHH